MAVHSGVNIYTHKVADFGTNWKRVYDFLLVVNSITLVLSCFVSDIMQVFCWKQRPHLYSTRILLMFSLHWIANVGAPRNEDSFNFEVTQLIWPRYLNVTDGRTDRRMTYCSCTESSKNPQHYRHKVLTSSVYPYLWCLMVFTIRLGQGLGIWNVSVSISSRTLNVLSRSRLGQNAQRLSLVSVSDPVMGKN